MKYVSVSFAEWKKKCGHFFLPMLKEIPHASGLELTYKFIVSTSIYDFKWNDHFELYSIVYSSIVDKGEEGIHSHIIANLQKFRCVYMKKVATLGGTTHYTIILADTVDLLMKEPEVKDIESDFYERQCLGII